MTTYMFGFRSVLDVINEQKDKYRTRQNTKDMFRVGDAVKIIVPAQDHTFFDKDHTYGTVVEIRQEYYWSTGIKVALMDRARQGVTVMGFEPSDIIKIERTAHEGRLQYLVQEYIQNAFLLYPTEDIFRSPMFQIKFQNPHVFDETGVYLELGYFKMMKINDDKFWEIKSIIGMVLSSFFKYFTAIIVENKTVGNGSKLVGTEYFFERDIRMTHTYEIQSTH